MTTEEAIRILESGSTMPDIPHTAEMLDKALDMAITALRAQAAIVHCKDCKHLYFKDFKAFCRYRVLPCRPSGFCEHGERRE